MSRTNTTALAKAKARARRVPLHVLKALTPEQLQEYIATGKLPDTLQPQYTYPVCVRCGQESTSAFLTKDGPVCCDCFTKEQDSHQRR